MPPGQACCVTGRGKENPKNMALREQWNQVLVVPAVLVPREMDTHPYTLESSACLCQRGTSSEPGLSSLPQVAAAPAGRAKGK